MSAPDDVTAATTADVPSQPDGEAEAPKGAESAPAVVSDTDEVNRATTSGVGKRIDELTRNWRETERDRDYWRELALRTAEYERGRQAPEPQTQPAQQSRTLADFGGDQDQFAHYLLSEVDRRANEKLQELDSRRAQESAAERRNGFESAAMQYADTNKISDMEIAFRHPAQGGPNITPEMAETILDSENGPAIAYYLAKNPAIASQISRLPALQQAREIGRIEANLTTKAKAPVASSAPPPAPTLAASEPGVEKDPEKMSDKEWLAWRNKQLARQRKESRP